MDQARPLQGVTIVEFGHSVAAPYAGLILADLGARVVKVENPDGGDYARGWGPPFWNGPSSCFHSLNRGKESIAVDFADRAQAEALRTVIVEQADAVIQNLRPGALRRYGLDAKTLCSLKPDLIWCDIGAFGEEGPLSEKPGYDPLMQAFAGIMSVTGTGDGAPVRVGVSLVDLGTGMWTVIGLLASLLERGRSGKTPRVSTSLFETSLAWMTVPLAGYAASGDIRRPYGSGVAEIVPYQAFAAEDGWLMIAAGNDKLFGKLCAALGMAELADRPEFVTNGDRVVNRDALIDLIARQVATWRVEELAAQLDEAGVPNSILNSVDKVFAHEQTRALEMIAADAPGGLASAGIPLSFDRARPRAAGSAPALGEHNGSWNRVFGAGRSE